MSLKELRKKWRNWRRVKIKSKIKADLQANHIVNLPKNCIVRLEIHGKNNTVEFPAVPHPNSDYKIRIFGDNNTVRLPSADLQHLDIHIGDSESLCRGATLSVGEETQINGAEIYIYEDGSSVTIGKGCLFSWGIVIWCTDTHTVTDLSGKPLNRGRSIAIGDHVWVGRDVHIGKNSAIPPHSIVGWCSNVMSEFAEPHVVIAGNPAKIVKRNISWSRERYNQAAARYAEAHAAPALKR